MLDDYTLDVFDLFGITQEPAAPTTKTCRKCGEDKPLSEYNRRKGSRDGVRYVCKACAAAYGREYREANKDAIRETKRAWKRANRDHCNAKSREWKRASPDKVRESNRRYREENLETVRSRSRESARRYREENPDKVREATRRWRKANPDKAVAYRHANNDEIRCKSRAYYAEHRDEIRQKREDRCQWCVYRIDFASSDASDAFYVGSSNRPDLRFNSHKSRAMRGRNSHALNEQDWSTATWRVLFECDTEAEALEVEYRIIEEHMDDPKNLNTQAKEKRSKHYWVYVIQSEQKRVSKKTGKILEGYFYIGMTTDPARRLREHNGRYANGKMGKKGGGKWTSKHRPWVARSCFGPYFSRSEALRAEYRLKHSKRGKARCYWTPEDSPLCRGEGVDHPWVSDPVGWRPPKA